MRRRRAEEPESSKDDLSLISMVSCRGVGLPLMKTNAGGREAEREKG